MGKYLEDKHRKRNILCKHNGKDAWSYSWGVIPRISNGLEEEKEWEINSIRVKSQMRALLGGIGPYDNFNELQKQP